MSPQAVSLKGPTEKVTCKLCGRQFAKYNCPTCDVAYCSLTCFRSPIHSRCSETFYKKEVEQEIHSQPSKTLQERMKMMELLRKFEENQQDSKLSSNMHDGDDEQDDDDDDNLDRRFLDMDLDSASTRDVWSKLTPSEQQKFLTIMENPAGGLAKQLLASQELEREQIEPWWESPIMGSDHAPEEGILERRHGEKPHPMVIPSSMIKPIPNGLLLFYNICAVCIAYAFTTRHLSVSPLSLLKPDTIDFEEARHLISHLIPFMTDRKSTMLFPNLSSMTTDVWSRFKPDQINTELFALLLRDTARLVRPVSVMIYRPDTLQSQAGIKPTSHPHINLIRVLSDLADVFKRSPRRDGDAVKLNHTTHKLLFYAANILSTPSSILHKLSEQLDETSVAYMADSIGDVITDSDIVKNKESIATIQEL